MPVCGNIDPNTGNMVYDPTITAQNCVTNGGYYVLTSDDIAALTNNTVDPAVAAQYWSFAMGAVVGLYLVSKYVGEISGFIKSAIR